MLQRHDFCHQALYGRVLVGVAVPQRTQARSLRGQLCERGGEVGVPLNGPDHRERVGGEAARVTGGHQQPLQRLAVLLDPIPVGLHAEEGPELGIRLGALAAAGPAGHSERHGRRSIARQRNRPFPKSLEPRLGAPQIPLRALQLLRQDLRELGKLFALQVRRHLHVAFGHRVDHGGDARCVGAPQLEPKEVPFLIQLRAQRVRQRARGIPQGRQTELDGPVGRQRAGGGRPGQPQPGSDRITHRPALQDLALNRGECVTPTVRVHLETIQPWAVLPGHLQRRQEGFVGSRLRAHEQPLVADHLIEHHV